MRRSAFVAMIATGLLLGSCSKTQDTAPETRLFGSPPVIQNVSISNTGAATAVCDISEHVATFLCQAGGFPPTDVIYTPVTLRVNFTEAFMTVQASDPDTQPGGQNDILLVSASYAPTPGNETSLILLDDGSTNAFPYSQASLYLEKCDVNACACGPAQYSLTSNDAVANDGTYTRGFAMISQNIKLTNLPNIPLSNADLARDCVASGAPTPMLISGGVRQYPAITDKGVGQPVPFKMEVVDRSGNLTLWPTQPSVTFSQTTFTCEGDDCACCLMLTNEFSKCSGLTGMQGVDPNGPYPNGVCKSF